MAIWVVAIGLALSSVGCGASLSASAKECAALRRTSAPVTDRGVASATGAQISIAAGSAAFTPTCVTGVPQGTVTLVVHNVGQVIHNIQVATQHIDVDIAPGATVTVRVAMGDRPVTYVCKYHRQLGMIGFLVPASG